MTSFKEVWQECEYYLDNNISIIPVRDKPQSWNGREYPVKSAYPWKQWQSKIISKGELMHLMTDKYDTIGFGIVAGKVSGNLEIIDVDVKNWQGIDAMLFQDLKAIYPDLFNKLRIHQTPSKGYHIFYKIEDHCPEGNRKLAWKEGEKEAAIETRGESGYVVATSSLGYKVVKDNPIPTITWNERCSIIAICEGYNQKVKVVKPLTTNYQNDYYDENPFDHFNNSPAAENVLLNNGWKLCGSSNNFIWFTRPDKSSGVSASFNRSKRVYYIFTSSTQLEPSKGYNPATLMAILEHNADKKQLHKWLVDNGYGKVKPHKEKIVAKNAARKGFEVPANLSEEAKQLAINIKGELEQLHPFGTFWEYNEDNKVVINREQLMLVANYLGFKYYVGNVVKVDGYLLYKIDEREFQDAIKEYIKEPDNDEYFKICNSLEAFLESHGKYTMKRLPILDETIILKDTANTAFKFFLNGYLTIDKSNITFCEYDSLEMLIWSEKVQQRNYNKGIGGKYVDFLQLATSDLQHVKNCIGYLTHEYKDETTGYIIVCSEQCQNPEDGGGSGKNVFCKLLENSTTYTSKPGAQSKFDEKFFQSWNGQKIFCISDLPERFDFIFLKELSTGSFIWKKLFKDEVEVKSEDAPKILCQTNYSVEIKDGGLKRRVIFIEFTNFFTLCGGLDVHFGCHFPKGWSVEDWAGYDNFIAESIQSWLIAARKLSSPILTEGGWLKQFKQTYGNTINGLINEFWQRWCEMVEVSNDDFKRMVEGYYLENNTPRNYQPSTQKINDALKAFGKKQGVNYEYNQQKKVGYVNQKFRFFLQNTPF